MHWNTLQGHAWVTRVWPWQIKEQKHGSRVKAQDPEALLRHFDIWYFLWSSSVWPTGIAYGSQRIKPSSFMSIAGYVLEKKSVTVVFPMKSLQGCFDLPPLFRSFLELLCLSCVIVLEGSLNWGIWKGRCTEKSEILKCHIFPDLYLQRKKNVMYSSKHLHGYSVCSCCLPATNCYVFAIKMRKEMSNERNKK